MQIELIRVKKILKKKQINYNRVNITQVKEYNYQFQE